MCYRVLTFCTNSFVFIKICYNKKRHNNKNWRHFSAHHFPIGRSHRPLQPIRLEEKSGVRSGGNWGDVLVRWDHCLAISEDTSFSVWNWDWAHFLKPLSRFAVKSIHPKNHCGGRLFPMVLFSNFQTSSPLWSINQSINKSPMNKQARTDRYPRGCSGKSNLKQDPRITCLSASDMPSCPRKQTLAWHNEH